MCGHCGCQEVGAIGELRDEHAALTDDMHDVRRALGEGDRLAAGGALGRLAARLAVHVRREEVGLFTALRDQGDFADEVVALEAEHLDLDAALVGLHVDGDDFPARVLALLDDLDQHIEREDLGIFPVSVVTLGAAGWETVERAREEHPSFLTTGAPGASRRLG